jgi:Spy/CpxP family protein refolding chaperone
MGQGMGPGYGMGQGMGPGYGMGPGRMGGFGPGGMMRGGIGPYEAGVLGLDEGQRRELESIQRESARDHWQLMQELRARRIAMMQLYRDNPAPDPEAVGEAHEAWADAQRRMLEHQARVHNRMREVLTQEQRERLDEMQRFGWGSGTEAE